MAKAVVKIEGERAAAKLQIGDGTFLKMTGGLRAAHAEEGVGATSGERRELAAGERDAVDFMECIGKEGDAR